MSPFERARPVKPVKKETELKKFTTGITERYSFISKVYTNGPKPKQLTQAEKEVQYGIDLD